MRQLKITQQVTKRDEIAVEKYLTDISPIPMIDAEREAQLAYLIRTENDREAYDELVRSNLRFVVSVAKQYQGQGLSLADLINEGNLGLHKAAGRFDETKGFKFISYAVWWIRQHILQGLAQQGRVVRIPQNKIATINKVRRATADLMQEFERAPTVYELADYLETTVDDVQTAMNNEARASSLDAPVGSDPSASTRMELMENTNAEGADEGVNIESLKSDINQALTTLTPRERKVIRLFYGIDTSHAYSLEEIAEDMEVTRERVRQIKEKALRRLRLKSTNKNLNQHLG
tara:strand:+ start:222 stop:1091 length:870 start_codon:yes stop_codon:yes gene_type:complete